MPSDQLPDFRWSAFYYLDQLAALIDFKTTAWPEHTETDLHDPVIQLLRLFALVGHGQAARLDHVALELYLTTARLRQSFVGMGALVDYQLALAVPATVDVLSDLTSSAAVAQIVVAAHSIFATAGTADSPAILFEHNTDLALTMATGAWGYGDWTNDASVPTSLTLVEDHTGGELAATLWGGAGLPTANRGGLLFWHPELQFDKLGIVVGTPSSDLDTVRWEYYDDSRVLTPDSVTDLGGSVRVDVTTLVGGVAGSTGLEITVTSLRTGVQETIQTTGSAGGVQTADTSGSLGQTTISTDAADYTVTTTWPELPDVVDGTISGGKPLQVSGSVSWTLPQAATRRWAPVTLTDGTTSIGPVLAVRARVTSTTGPAVPALDASTEPSGTTWSALVNCTQGERVVEKIGTTDVGTASQAFTLRRSPLLELTSVVLSDGTWTEADSFLSSSSFDRHYTLTEQPNGDQVVTFGDGTRGKIPPASSAVTATYRIGGGQSGNVGALAIVRDRTGNGKITNPRNPRVGSGWVVQEGTTDDSLNLLRTAIPASIRAGDRAVTPADAEALAIAFRTTAGAQVAERALAVEEGLGPKTVQLVVVGPSGVAPTSAQLTELDDYFNGEQVGLQRVGGVGMSNTETTAQAYTPRVVDVTASVSVLADFADGAEELITASLEGALQPSAKRLILNADGLWVESTDFQWDYGGTVSLAFLLARIVTAIPGVVTASLSVPAADIALAATELPVPGTITITVVSV